LEGLQLAQQQLQSGNTAPDWQQQQQQEQGQRDAGMLCGLDLLNSMNAPGVDQYRGWGTDCGIASCVLLDAVPLLQRPSVPADALKTMYNAEKRGK
jgi:hypothetical protein